MDYYKRFIEKDISECLQSSGAVCVNGPKFVGKTTTGKLFSKSYIELINESTIEIAKSDLNEALNGDRPRLIDEWQTIPDIWNRVRHKVDLSSDFGQFILTGSATPLQADNIFHSGAGRIVPVLMRTMSLQESEDSTGEISLKKLFYEKDYKFVNFNEDYSIKKTAYLMCRGGWPLSVGKNDNISLRVTRNYYKGLFNLKQSENLSYRRKSEDILEGVLSSYARNVSTEASYSTILKDAIAKEQIEITRKTFDSYVNILKDLFIIEDMPAWCPNLRSKAVIRSAPTRHFIDTSIACCAINATPENLFKDVKTFGLLFEDFCVRDLRVYMDYLGGKTNHYRDSNGLECDCVLHLDDGNWAPVEIKLGGKSSIEHGAATLTKFVNNIDTQFVKPSFMMILTASGAAYRREDGIYVVPINLLGV